MQFGGCETDPVDELAGLIAASHTRWMPRVVEAVFGSNEPVIVADVLISAVASAVAVPVRAALFYEPGVGVVVGFELHDGRSVVAKVHRASYVTQQRLAAIVRVQADLAAAGLPAPAPLAGPVALGDGWLTVEELRVGDCADGYDPAVRRCMATALYAFIDAARSHAASRAIGSWLTEPLIDGVWPEPHDLRFDLPATRAGAEWIDTAGHAARATLAATGLPNVVGHLDWRVQNLAFAARHVSAIYDWDSIGVVSEAALVGSASVIHPVDWRRQLPDPLPTLEQLDGFVADYEIARGASFTDDEREILNAGQHWITSYGARCQHSDHLLGVFPDVDHALGWPRLLRELLNR
jgi:hypothetical protein